MADSGEIYPGRIVWIYPRDPTTQATLTTAHPAIVLTPQEEIDAGLDLFVVVCTTTFQIPLRSGWFHIPTAPGGHSVTGLDQACVAKATWTDVVPQSNVLRLGKRVKASLVRQIEQWLRDKERDMERKRDEPPLS